MGLLGGSLNRPEAVLGHLGGRHHLAEPPSKVAGLAPGGVGRGSYIEIGAPEDFLKVGPPGGATFESYFFNFFQLSGPPKSNFFQLFLKNP